MKRIILFALAATLPIFHPSTALAESRLINGIAAIVFDSVVTFEEVERQVASFIPSLESRFGRRPEVLEQKLQDLRKERLEELVERKMILHEFKQAGYQFPDSMIDDRIKELVRERFGDRVKLTKTLQSTGSTYEQFRQQFRDQWIVEQMRLKNINSEIMISPFKIERYYQEHQDDFKVGDQVKLRMIFLDKSKHGAGTRKLADEILSKLKEGASFQEMASVYSDGAQRKEGGDYGWREKSFLREDLARTAFALKPGEYSPVIDSDTDCHLIQIEDMKPAHTKTLAEVRTEIEKSLRTQEQDRLHKAWVQRLRNKSFVRFF